MSRNVWIGFGVGLLVGGGLGYALGTRRPAESSPASVAAAPTSPASMADPGLQHRIFAAQQALLQNPKDLQAWISLGNDYFDSHQPQKAVDAYAKALELDPSNADLLTDQGVMYRQLMAYDKAVANFERAAKVNPKHVQCLYNLGVVCAEDLKAPDRALKAWTRVIEIAPDSPRAADARKAIAAMKAARAPKP